MLITRVSVCSYVKFFCFFQVIGPRAVDLDHLVEEMTEFYRTEENRELHAIKEVQNGEILFVNTAHSNWGGCCWTDMIM